MRGAHLCFCLWFGLWGVSVWALTVEELDPSEQWWTAQLRFVGNRRFSSDELRAGLVTKTRPWYTPWQPLPRFDPVAFAADLERIRRFYHTQGYYAAQVAYDLAVDPATHQVTATVSVQEGEPVKVAQVTVTVTDQPAAAAEFATFRGQLPLREGMVFTEALYHQTEEKIKAFFLDRHHGRVSVTRHAEVILDQRVARVYYTVTAGPRTVFGPTRIEGAKTVAPTLIARELMYTPGQPFSAAAVAASRQNLLALNLFSSVRFLQEEFPPDPAIVPMRVQVEEKPSREWQLGVGYGTEGQFRGQVRWRNHNWLGSGRQLDIGAKYSSLDRNLSFTFLQPHFLSPRTRFSAALSPLQISESSYLLNATRVQPRLERKFSSTVSGFLAYRLEYDKLNNVAAGTIRALRDFQREGVLSGLSLGLVWNTADDPLNPVRGGIVSLSIEQVGDFLGGDFSFYKAQGEAKKYSLLAEDLVFASRLKIGVANPTGNSKEVPLFERFFAGGGTGVRGYGRNRLGPISEANDPVGGHTLIEGSLELRRQFSPQIGGAVFLDFGYVSLRSFTFPLDALKYAAGLGVRYTTPVGPFRLDVGFPFDPPRKDQPWQVHFSIGQFF
ncbi:MAG: outer membrane protein assembly factor BamA [Candidatus Binatia bacterium]|nr:outer membrane protein assembly factor BamA [Candidatus Binatia bacterium]